jgi:ribosomal protein S18 acetylase RimI-like enzyme
LTAIRCDANPEDVIRVLTLGFCADPVMRWLYPQPQSYMEHFPIVLKLFGGAAFDNEAALSVTDCCAAALLLPPNTHPDGDRLMAHFESTLAKDVLEDAYKVFDIMDKIHPVEPCWHLAFVASDPAHRSKGHGSALVDHMLARCDAEQAIAYLENTNPANTSFYQSRGFQIIGEIQAGKAPPMQAMRRDPL